MDGNHSNNAHADEDIVELGALSRRAALHRLAAARRDRGISYLALARYFGITVEEVRLQEEATDLSIGTLNRWAAALDMPVTDLVVEPEEWKHATHLPKDGAQRLMRVASRLRDRARRRSVQRLAQTFVEQLSEILPVLDKTSNLNRPNGTANKLRKPPRP